MRTLRAAFAACALVACSALAAAAREPTVIVLSWDGVRHDYLSRGELPALARVQREGTRAEKLVPVFPSITFPSHVSMATGAHVDRHGIVANAFRDRVRGAFRYGNDASWIEAEPIWVTAERQGVRSAVYFWVGSETDWHGTGASYRKTPFDPEVSEDTKVDQILAWLDLPPAERPRLVLSWWHGADGPGHRFGPDSPRIAQAMRGQDAALARLLAGLDARDAWPDTTLLIVSDHGMAKVDDPVDLLAPLREKGIAAELEPSNGVAHLWLADPTRRAETVALLAALPGVQAFPGDAVPASLRYEFPSRMGDVVAVTSPPRFFIAPRTLEGVMMQVSAALGREQGAHGFDPALPDMGGILLALGRGVPAGVVLPPVEVLDLAPTVALLLGIDPPRDAEGHPIPGLAGTPRDGGGS